MLKIGWIDYINTAPFNFELVGIYPDFKYQLEKGKPSQINRLLNKGDIDVGIVSSAEIIENPDKYIVLPNMSISAYQKVNSVSIFSNQPLEKLRKVYVSKASKSSRYLIQVIFNKFFKKDVEILDLENRVNMEDAGLLLIGDEALKSIDQFKYNYDLAEVWYKETSYPFVFALWAFNKNSAFLPVAKNFYSTVFTSRGKFFDNIDEYVPRIKTDFCPEFVKNYLLNLDYQLSYEHIKSLNLFGKLLKEAGVIPNLPVFRFLSV